MANIFGTASKRKNPFLRLKILSRFYGKETIGRTLNCNLKNPPRQSPPCTSLRLFLAVCWQVTYKAPNKTYQFVLGMDNQQADTDNLTLTRHDEASASARRQNEKATTKNPSSVQHNLNVHSFHKEFTCILLHP